ncbi:MAG: SGNH/GDSL hydrolase family protein [Lentisphaeria bacterium]|nr:SGNH/GDSL hydrolase family protein [Lentisphaeria bacterium]
MESSAVNGALPPFLKLTLPETVYAVPGIECNIYFETVLDTAVYSNYACEVRCERGSQGEHRWFWTPEKSDAGAVFDLELSLFNDYGKILSGTCKVVVAAEPEDPERKFTLSLLADSGVGCRYPDHILHVMQEFGFINYTPVGSHSDKGRMAAPGEAMHDGYGGFAWKSFLSRWVYSAEELPEVQNEAEAEQMRALGIVDTPKSNAYRLRSPLLKLEGGKVVQDLPGWLQKINGGNAPDYIVIQLGGNDIFIHRPEDLDVKVAEVMENARKLLAELRKAAPHALMGVTTCPLGCGQDGFGKNYNCMQSRYQYRRNAQCYNRKITKLVKSLGDERISIIPLHQAIDPVDSYITIETPAHARSSRQVIRFNNGLHQTREGGYQIGDAIASWLIFQEGKKH